MNGIVLPPEAELLELPKWVSDRKISHLGTPPALFGQTMSLFLIASRRSAPQPIVLASPRSGFRGNDIGLRRNAHLITETSLLELRRGERLDGKVG
jgi:hypothetical protein